MLPFQGFSIGIYEKALPADLDWQERLTGASRAGFDYLEMSIDPSPLRLNRLNWTRAERIRLRHQVEDVGIGIRTICLSAHREFPLGSSNLNERARGLEILHKTIDLAYDLGIRLIQIAGYDTRVEPSTSASRERYRQALALGAAWASQAGVLLGLENQESGYISSITSAAEAAKIIDSPYLGLYSDMGNLVVNGLDVRQEIQAAHGKLFGVHIKDTKPGVPRRIPFGEGQVPFPLVFDQLLEIGFRGPITIEMWNDDRPDSEQISAQAYTLVKNYLEEAWQNRTNINS